MAQGGGCGAVVRHGGGGGGRFLLRPASVLGLSAEEERLRLVELDLLLWEEEAAVGMEVLG